ncbi:MAG: hypothetical protein N2376_15220, partial [Clostridia bacterium]|nr:hypothetical protein [Clostridia bacterium]
MIRRAAKEDNSRVLSFLAQEGSLNTTFFAHIEKYGYEKDFQDIWIYNGEQNETLAVIMRHFNALYLYSRDSLLDYDVLSSFVSFIGADVISGKLEILSEIALSVEGMVLEPSRHMVLARPESLVPCGAVERGRVEDCQELSELIYSIPEFARFYSSRLEIERGIRRRMELGICRYFVLRQDGVIASQAYTCLLYTS